MEVSKQDLLLSLYQAQDKNLMLQQFQVLSILWEHEVPPRKILEYHLVFLNRIMHHKSDRGNGLLNEEVKGALHNNLCRIL